MKQRDDSRVAHMQAQLRSALAKQSMCADHIKGYVEWSIDWSNGISVSRTDHSDYAERTLSDAAHAAVAHALIDGDVSVTIKVRRVKASEEGKAG